MLDRRKFIKNTSVLSTLPFLPNFNFFKTTKKFIRTAHIGVGHDLFKNHNLQNMFLISTSNFREKNKIY